MAHILRIVRTVFVIRVSDFNSHLWIVCGNSGEFADELSMQFDPMIANPGRLSILTALCAEMKQDFVTLRRATELTDGNLTTHARKLASAGLVAIEKASRHGRPVTYITLTHHGRDALTRHVQTLTKSITSVRTEQENVTAG